MNPESLFRWEMVYTISHHPVTKLYFPVMQYIGSDQRDVRYKDYVLQVECPDNHQDKSRSWYGKFYYVWRSGGWKTKRVYLDNKTRDEQLIQIRQEKLPRSICQFLPGDVVWDYPYSSYQPNILLVSEILPGGKYTRFYAQALVHKTVKDPHWYPYSSSYDMLDPNRWCRTSFEEITTHAPELALPFVEANLLL